MAVMDIVLRAIDKVSPVMDKIAKKSNTSFDSISRKFKTAEGSLLAVGGGMVIVGGIITVISGKLLKMASDAEETSSKFATVFRDVSDESEAMAKNLSRNYGLSSTAAKKMLGDTGDLLTGFGFTGEAALDLSSEVNKLAVDLASFTNFSGGAEGASQALTKALLGERESVKALGISILEEDVKAKMALMTKQGMTFETERQAKAYATLLIAQEQSKNAIGDFERTSESFANQQRILNARLGDMAVILGEKILPIGTKVLSWAIKIVEKLTDWAERHPILTGILVKFAAALGLLVGTGGMLILGALAFIKMAGAIKTSIEFYRSLSGVLPLVTAKVWAFTAAILANPITWWVIGITAVIAAIVLLWKNWEKISEWISRKIDWICDKFKWLGDKVKWVAEKLGIYKEKTTELIEETDNLKEKIDETKTSIDDLAIAETEAETAARLLAEENIKLATSLENVGEEAAAAAEGVMDYADKVTENYIQLALKATDSWADFNAFWVEDARIAAENIIAINEEVEASTPKPKKSNLYKIVDAEGKTIGLQSGNILSQEAKEEGITLVKIHGGGEVRTTIPGGEGLALLKDEEIVRTPEQEKRWGTNITIQVAKGAIQMTSSRIDEREIRRSGNLLFEQLTERLRAYNLSWVGR